VKRGVLIVVAAALMCGGGGHAVGRAHAADRNTSRTMLSSAVLTVGSFPTMNAKRPRYDYASALFIDSTRGTPEVGYWKVPAGDVILLAGADTVMIPPSRDVYSGVGYFSKDNALRYAAGTTYTMIVSGSDSVGPIRASVVAPAAPRITSPDTNAVVPRTHDLVVSWTPGAPGDSVQLGFQPHNPSGHPHLVYRAPDSGRFSLARDLLYDFPSDYALMITITRRRDTPVQAMGLRDGALSAQAADFVHIYLEKR
jgi:hypothetical protein